MLNTAGCSEQYLTVEPANTQGVVLENVVQGVAETAPRGPGVTEPPAISKLEMGRQRAQGLLRGLLLVLRDHNAPKSVMDSFKTQVLDYLTCEEEAVYVKRAKYLTVAPMARYLRADAPKSPPLVWKPIGQYKRWAKFRMGRVTRRNTHLWYSFLQAKRCAHPLTEGMVRLAYEDHRAAMEIEDPIDEVMLESCLEQIEPVLATIAKQLTKTYMPSTLEEYLSAYELPGPGPRHVASTRACYERSRDKGGQLGRLTELAFYRSRDRQEVPDLDRMVYQTEALVNGVVRRNCMTECYRYKSDEQVWRDTIHGHALDYRGKRIMATIQVVLEPLKTRVISKGESIPYYVSKPLQVAIHDIMRRMDCFRLIGRPLSATDLMDLDWNRVIAGVGPYEWFSIDYSAATDGLSAKLSAAILDRLVRDQRSDLKEVWKSVLAPHRCRYPFPHDQAVKPVNQRNGQLMGSILSFPVLCLANLALYLTTIEDDDRPLSEKLAGVLINGDDMLYVARRSLWEKHVSYGKRVGLLMSPGKAYHHGTFANANSACFHYKLTSKFRNFGVSTNTPVAIPFLNSGLYFGQNKVMNKSETMVSGPEQSSKVTVIGELLKGTRGGESTQRVLAGYLKRHGEQIHAECQGRQIFFPCSLGGMGVEAVVPFKSTVAQRQLAYRLLMNSPNGHLGFGPLPGPVPEETPTELRAPWLVPETLEREKRYLKGRQGLRELAQNKCHLMRVCSVPRASKTRTEAREVYDPDWESFTFGGEVISVESFDAIRPVKKRMLSTRRTAIDKMRLRISEEESDGEDTDVEDEEWFLGSQGQDWASKLGADLDAELCSHAGACVAFGIDDELADLMLGQ